MLKTLGILGLIALIAALLIGGAYAIDLPHTGNCNACHMIHNSLGPSLTNQATNELLCMSCHKIGGAASMKPFASSDQAIAGTSGTSHGWSVSMAAGVPPLNLQAGNPNNKYGLKTVDEITDAGLKAQIQKANNQVACSVCHNQHLHVGTPWNPYAGAGPRGDSGSVTTGSAGAQVSDATKSAVWAANSWVGYYVRIMMGDPANLGHVGEVTTNTTTQLNVTPPFPAPIAAGDRYEIIGRSFQRVNSDLNLLCVECHAYRLPTSVPTGGVSQTDVRTWDGNAKSHPINRVFTSTTRDVTDPTKFNASVLEPAAGGWAAQTGNRYHMNGGTDTNVTNNLVMGADGQIKCLTCHGMHYTDSNAATVDVP